MSFTACITATSLPSFLQLQSVICSSLHLVTPVNSFPPLSLLPRSRPFHHPPLSLGAPTPISSTSPTLPYLHLPICHPCSSPTFPPAHCENNIYNFCACNPCVWCLHLTSLSYLVPPSLSLRASRECQNKERLLEQRFRAALRDFQQWLVNAKISTAKCFDMPQNVTEASTSRQRIQVRDTFFLCINGIKSWACAILVMGIWDCTFLITHGNHSFPVYCCLKCSPTPVYPRIHMPNIKL